jgi:sugar transferase (PEP-CTERM system associated)
VIRIFSQYVSPKSLLLAVLEAGFIGLGLLCGARLRFWNSPEDFASYVQAPSFGLQAAVFVVTLQVCFYYSDLYDLNAVRQRRNQLVSLGQSLGAASLFLGMVYFAVPDLLIGRGVFFISTALVAVFALTARVVLDAAWHVAAPKQQVLILGAERAAMVVAGELMRRDDLNVEVAGFLEATPSPAEERELLGRPVLGTLSDLERVVAERQISRIVVALEDRRGALPIRDLVRLRVSGVRVEDAHSALASLSGRIWLEMVRPSWFIFSDGFRRSRTTLILKRIIDLSFGLLGLVISFPIMVAVAFAVKLDSKGPALFRQTRVGYKGKTFELLKFRSMRVDAEAGGAQWAQKNDARATRLGKHLRKFRLDELPQFINVIRGDMSFVGPRPERPVFVDRLREVISYYDERHSVRPGLTGWAQVEYSYGANVEDAVRKAEYDLFYLKNMSLFFDCVIVLKTIRIIMTGRGAH